jgi:Domain of unknown function (DUF1963)
MTVVRNHSLTLAAKRMDLTRGQEGSLLVTKVGGKPWWPNGLPRPLCGKNHEMAFEYQVNLADLPSWTDPPGIISFHYCRECVDVGEPSPGWPSDAVRSGYDVRIHDDVTVPVDEGDPVARRHLQPYLVSLCAIEDVPSPEDLAAEGVSPLPAGRHWSGSKVGGWPSWVQSPSWPNCEHGKSMRFVSQLKGVSGDEVWRDGYAYLFRCQLTCPRPRGAELVIQVS